jgi:hypothetical protein
MLDLPKSGLVHAVTALLSLLDRLVSILCPMAAAQWHVGFWR